MNKSTRGKLARSNLFAGRKSFLLAIVVSSVASFGQTVAPVSPQPDKQATAWPEVPTIQLVPGKTHPLPEQVSVELPVRCDESGLYVRSLEGQPSGTTIRKYNHDGAADSTFSFYFEYKEKKFLARFQEFALSEGRVYALTSNGPHHAEIVEFDGDGSLKSEIPLSPELPLVPSTVLALKQGFFVAGIMKANSSTEKARSFAAIYDQQGALVREIKLKDDISPSSPSTASAITFSRAVAGADGNVYLIRASYPSMIYVISSAGELIKHYVVQAPKPDAVPIVAFNAQGRIAIEFSIPTANDSADTRIRLIEGLTGQPAVDYKVTRDLTEFVGCYQDDHFVFYSTTIGKSPSIVESTTAE